MVTIYKVGTKEFTNEKEAEKYEKELDRLQKEKEKKALEQSKMFDEIVAKRKELRELENTYCKTYNISVEMPFSFDSVLKDIFKIS